MPHRLMDSALLRVLYVEDDFEEYALTREMLGSRSPGRFELRWVQSFADGLAALSSGEFDVCLLDYRLGGHDGPSFIVDAQRRAPRCPVILLTETEDPEVDAEALRLGAADYLVKQQLTPTLLDRAIRYAIRQRRSEEALREREEYYRALTENVSDVLTILDADGVIRYESPSVERVLGYRPEELIGTDGLALVHPDDEAMARLALWQAIAQGNTGQVISYRFRHRDGSWRMLESTGNARLDDPYIAGVVINSRDVTERHEAEERLRRVLSGVHCILWEAAIEQDGPVFNWDFHVSNEAAAQQFLPLNVPAGQTYEEVWASTVPPEDLARMHQTSARAFREGQSAYRQEFRCRNVQGELRWLAEDVHIEQTDPGRWRAFGVCIDITEKKEVEEALRLRERAIEALPQGLIITDAENDFPIVYCNPAFESITGYPPEETLGRNCRFLQGPDTDPASLAALRSALREGRPLSVELLNYRKSGAPFWNHATVSPIRDPEGRLTHFVGVINNVTPQKRLEEQLRQSQKMEAVGRLAGGVAHDFNNMLAVILGYSDVVLLLLDADHPTRHAVEEIKRAGERASTLTRQLLAFSRKQVLSPKTLDLNETLDGMEKMLRRLIGEDIDLVTVHDPQLRQVRADPGQLEQVLLNLAVNARDAMPHGGRIVIETRNTIVDERRSRSQTAIPPGRYVTLLVSDTGCGMDRATVDQIFEPFFTTKEQGQGTGLGLAMVYGIVKQSEGHIEVCSEPGGGSQFSIHLPAVNADVEPSSTDGALDGTQNGTETILVVEDEPMVRTLVVDILKMSGYHVLQAENAAAAQRVLDQSGDAIQLLLTDVVMPGQSGRELAEAALTARPHLRVLFMSAYMDDAVMRHGIATAVTAFIQKPFSPAALTRKVREILGEKTVSG